MTFTTANRDSFTRMMRSLPTGVCVITAINDEEPAGMTASSLTPVSFEPMLIALALRPASGTLATARAAGRFAINFIAADRAAIAVQFASRRRGLDKYLGIPHRLYGGAPVLDEARAWLVCELRSAQPIGDHVLAIGGVRAMHFSDPSALPLITHRGRLAALTTAAP